MSLSDLIAELKNANGPDRSLDRKIAMMVGHRGADEKVSYYTSSIDHACGLAEYVDPNLAGAFKWGGGEFASAQIEGRAPVEAATPALAICVAALELLRK